MVKADAYGHGFSFVCTSLNNYVDMFAVSSIAEGVEVRTCVDKDILVLGVSDIDFIKEAIENDLTLSINSYDELEEYIKILDQINKNKGFKLKIHIAIDSGMNRFGIKYIKELFDVLNLLKNRSDILVQGVYSHLNDTNNKKYTNKQIKRYIYLFNICNKYFDGLISHIEASSGILSDIDYPFTMVRCGIIMYGVNGEKFNLKHVSSLKSSVLLIKDVKKGEKIGYLRKYTLKKDSKIGIISGGYHDGINKLLSNKSYVIIKNTKCKIIGNICMDCFMCDLSKVDAKKGDIVTIFSENYTIEEFLNNTRLIPYEIFTGLSKRVKRVYDKKRS